MKDHGKKNESNGAAGVGVQGSDVSQVVSEERLILALEGKLSREERDAVLETFSLNDQDTAELEGLRQVCALMQSVRAEELSSDSQSIDRPAIDRIMKLVAVNEVRRFSMSKYVNSSFKFATWLLVPLAGFLFLLLSGVFPNSIASCAPRLSLLIGCLALATGAICIVQRRVYGAFPVLVAACLALVVHQQGGGGSFSEYRSDTPQVGDYYAPASAQVSGLEMVAKVPVEVRDGMYDSKKDKPSEEVQVVGRGNKENDKGVVRDELKTLGTGQASVQKGEIDVAVSAPQKLEEKQIKPGPDSRFDYGSVQRSNEAGKLGGSRVVQTETARGRTAQVFIKALDDIEAQPGVAYRQVLTDYERDEMVAPSQPYGTIAPPYYGQRGSENYAQFKENEYVAVLTEPLSTFSIDVDTASYANTRRFLRQGSLPPADAVRIEELINYFDYGYQGPDVAGNSGSDNAKPFNVILDIAKAPWKPEHKIVRIGLQGRRIDGDALPASNLVFLLDVSGSMMEPNKLPLVQSSLDLLVEKLRPQDKVSIVVYAGAAGEVLGATSGSEKERIRAAIRGVQGGGSTAGGAGINLAYDIAKRNFIHGGNNRVILATDGDFNVGVSSVQELERLIEARRQDGVFLSVLGFGTGNLKDAQMETLANKGNGNFSYIDSIREAKKVLVSEMSGTLFTIAKDVKLQIEFNPALVKAYRLIGYENRMLNKEDFNDDRKDAGELGAGHNVTALYELIMAGSSEGVASVDALKYQQPTPMPTSQATGQIQSADISLQIEKGGESALASEVLTVKLRYKEPSGDTSKLLTQVLTNSDRDILSAPESMRFAVAVAQFGSLLRASKFREGLSYASAIQLAKGAKGSDDAGLRAEAISLMEQAELLSRSVYQGSVSTTVPYEPGHHETGHNSTGLSTGSSYR